MPATVPFRRLEPSASLVKVGQPVSSLTWQQLGGIGNWLRGKGAVLVPWCTPFRRITASSNNTFRFRVKTRSSAIQRVWLVYLKTSGSASATITAPASGGTAVTVGVPDEMSSSPFVYIENLASQSATEQQIDINIAATGVDVDVLAISCYEQDRPILEQDTTDYGVDLYTLSNSQPIADFAYQSIGGVYDTLTNADARRVGLYHWTIGDGTSASTNSSTPANLLSVAVPILTRKLARTATTGSVKWAAYAKVTAGTGTITMSTTQSGVSDSHSITGTSYAWTAARTVSVSCDDMDSTDGRQTAASPVWDDMQFAISCTGGTLTVQSISVWDDS